MVALSINIICKKKNSVLITIPTCPLEGTDVAVQMLQFCTLYLYLHFHPRRFNFLTVRFLYFFILLISVDSIGEHVL